MRRSRLNQKDKASIVEVLVNQITYYEAYDDLHAINSYASALLKLNAPASVVASKTLEAVGWAVGFCWRGYTMDDPYCVPKIDRWLAFQSPQGWSDPYVDEVRRAIDFAYSQKLIDFELKGAATQSSHSLEDECGGAKVIPFPAHRVRRQQPAA